MLIDGGSRICVFEAGFVIHREVAGPKDGSSSISYLASLACDKWYAICISFCSTNCQLHSCLIISLKLNEPRIRINSSVKIDVLSTIPRLEVDPPFILSTSPSVAGFFNFSRAGQNHGKQVLRI